MGSGRWMLVTCPDRPGMVVRDAGPEDAPDLIAVPGELGETYAAAYALIARGRTLPHEGRWVTGARTSAPTRQPARL
ncbi:hypothetical protein [Sphaerisporangium rhizosphaerae]|uniref:Uncharacterized protein n=1 Tax=Sphaerisporangium rhizosphaerae TaxID=2269375 RepID=A0ABW2P0J5_9ACTN